MKKVMLLAFCGVLSFSTVAANKDADTTQQAETVCDLTWEQITDVIINKQTPETAVDKAMVKIKRLAPSLNEASTNQMRSQLLTSLQTSTSDAKFASMVKSDTQATHQQFMQDCLTATTQKRFAID